MAGYKEFQAKEAKTNKRLAERMLELMKEAEAMGVL